jgi:hypothetical protein
MGSKVKDQTPLMVENEGGTVCGLRYTLHRTDNDTFIHSPELDPSDTDDRDTWLAILDASDTSESAWLLAMPSGAGSLNAWMTSQPTADKNAYRAADQTLRQLLEDVGVTF